MSNQEILWKQYDKHLELYKFYLEIVTKINVFHFAISGAIFSFYFANRNDEYVFLSLLLPALFSICLFGLFLYSGFSNLTTRRDVFSLRDKLKLDVAPELLVLTVFLWIFSAANLLTFVGAIYMVLKHLCA